MTQLEVFFELVFRVVKWVKGMPVRCVLGVVIGVVIGAIAIALLITDRVGEKYFYLMLVLALGAGLCIAYIGPIKKFTAGLTGISLESYENGADTIKRPKLDVAHSEDRTPELKSDSKNHQGPEPAETVETE